MLKAAHRVQTKDRIPELLTDRHFLDLYSEIAKRLSTQVYYKSKPKLLTRSSYYERAKIIRPSPTNVTINYYKGLLQLQHVLLLFVNVYIYIYKKQQDMLQLYLTTRRTIGERLVNHSVNDCQLCMKITKNTRKSTGP